MEKEIEKVAQNGTEKTEQSPISRNGEGISKAYEAAMKAFTMTNKRLHPELYEGNTKVGKIRR